MKRRPMRTGFTLRSRTALALGLIAIALPVGGGLWELSRARHALADRARESQLDTARIVASEGRLGFDLVVPLLQQAAGSSRSLVRAFRAQDRDAHRAYVKNAYTVFPRFRTVAVLDPRAKPLAQFPVPLSRFAASFARERAPEVSPPQRLASDAIVVVRLPVVDRAGRKLGLVVFEVSFRKTNPALESTRVGRTGAVAAVDRAGRVLFSTEPARRRRALSVPELRQLAGDQRAGTVNFFSDATGRDEIGAIAPIEGRPWSILVTRAESEVLRPASDLARTLLIGIGVLVLAGLAITFLVFRTLAGQEEQLRASIADRERVRALQASILPERLPSVPGVAMAARYLPGGEEGVVGGDWYDAIELPGGELGLVVGDVVGRGVRAAVLMGQLRNALRAYALEGHSPAQVVERLSNLARGDHPEMATVVFLVVDPASGMAHFVSAGHPPPLLLSPEAEPRYLEEARAVPLGALAHPSYEDTVVSLGVGSTLLLYTDGLIEKRGFGLEHGLAQLAKAAGSGPREPEELCDHIVQELLGGVAGSDDVALLAVRVSPALGEPLHLRLPAIPTVLAPMRHTLARWLREAGVAPERVGEVLVASNEAVANAVEHAYGPGEAYVELAATVSSGSVALTVRDHGTWRPPRGTHRGLGTKLMQSMMDEVEVSSTHEGTEVKMRRRLAQGGLV